MNRSCSDLMCSLTWYLPNSLNFSISSHRELTVLRCLRLRIELSPHSSRVRNHWQRPLTLCALDRVTPSAVSPVYDPSRASSSSKRSLGNYLSGGAQAKHSSSGEQFRTIEVRPKAGEILLVYFLINRIFRLDLWPSVVVVLPLRAGCIGWCFLLTRDAHEYPSRNVYLVTFYSLPYVGIIQKFGIVQKSRYWPKYWQILNMVLLSYWKRIETIKNTPRGDY